MRTYTSECIDGRKGPWRGVRHPKTDTETQKSNCQDPEVDHPQNRQRLLKMANYTSFRSKQIWDPGDQTQYHPMFLQMTRFTASSNISRRHPIVNLVVAPTIPYHTSLRFHLQSTTTSRYPRDTSILSFLSLIRPDPNMSQSHHSKYYLEDEMSVFLVINNHASFYPVSYLFLDRNPSFQSPWAFSKTRLPCLSRDVCLSFPARWYRGTLRRKSHTTSWRDLPGVRGPSRFLL